MTGDGLLTYRQVAEALGVSPGTVRNLVAAGKLAVIKVTDYAVRFDPAELKRYQEARTEKRNAK